MLELTVPPTDAGVRLDLFLATGALAHLSRSRVQSLIEGGHVLLNHLPPAKPGAKLRAADHISWEEPAAVPVELAAEQMNLSVLYEDDDLLVVNKPAGLVTHPGPGNEEHTLVNALLAHCPTLSGIGGEQRPGIVHRLDKDTSGCLVVAKNDFAHRSLSAQFADRTTDKRYLALVRGVPRPASGTIRAPIGRHHIDRKKMAIVQPPRGRLAASDYKVIRTLTANGHPAALVECHLLTGRTHQIRVHMKHLGYPILGDALYGGPRPPDRQMLHSWKLGFTHPRNEARLNLTAPLPADFLALGIDPDKP